MSGEIQRARWRDDLNLWFPEVTEVAKRQKTIRVFVSGPWISQCSTPRIWYLTRGLSQWGGGKTARRLRQTPQALFTLTNVDLWRRCSFSDSSLQESETFSGLAQTSAATGEKLFLCMRIFHLFYIFSWLLPLLQLVNPLMWSDEFGLVLKAEPLEWPVQVGRVASLVKTFSCCLLKP